MSVSDEEEEGRRMVLLEGVRDVCVAGRSWSAICAAGQR
jgi:hypothetical protein